MMTAITDPAAPADPHALCASGSELHAAGRYEEAIALFRQAIALDPRLAEAHDRLGRSLNNLRRLDEATAAFREAVRLEPDSAEAHNHLGHVLRAQGALEEAATSFSEALRIDPGSTPAHHNLGIVHMALGDPGRAIECFERAVRLDVRDARGHLLLGMAWPALGKLDKAEAGYRAALALEPGNAEARLKLGLLLSELQRIDEAETELRKALELEPDNAQAWAELAALYERVSRLEDMRRALARALALSPDDPRVILEAARHDRRVGDSDAAVERLQGVDLTVLPPRLAQQFHFELGRLFDRRNDVDAAYGHFSQANRLGASSERMRQVDPQGFLQQINDLYACFANARLADWAPPKPVAAAETPVFLMGFPRSGTTLTDLLLDGHPRIRTLEEKPTLDAVIAFLEKNHAAGFPGALPVLSGTDIEELREVYFGELERHIERQPGMLIVDKLPIRTVHAGLIWRLFPQARIVFSLRHPCDVCLSGFMQQFYLTDAFANFFTLEDTVLIYDKVMRLWQLYVSTLKPEHHVVRYERLIDDLESETRRLIHFLGLPWDDAALDYTRRARERGRIRTSSYHQVTEPIYTHARYRWQRYRKYFEPLEERLAPHVRYFGYSLDDDGDH
ncbi:MAG: tetratricopeptide repeat-containing sulfotransferase family protein [Gammaproteobacteria bacterium]